MQVVDHDSFFKQLTALFESTKDTGSIWLTHKRLNHDGEDAVTSIDDDSDLKEHPCLVRVTDGKQLKLSTIVEPGDLNKFHSTYGVLLKSSMTSLRKRDKKREKHRAEEVARRKHRMTETVVIEGAKRGNGRRKRQRSVKQALKLEAIRRQLQEKEEAKGKKSA